MVPKRKTKIWIETDLRNGKTFVEFHRWGGGKGHYPTLASLVRLRRAIKGLKTTVHFPDGHFKVTVWPESNEENKT